MTPEQLAARTTKTVEVQVWSGASGPCLYINNYRICGPKPWGGKPVYTFNADLADLIRHLPKTEAKDMTHCPSFEAIAYGLLWRSLSDNSLVKTARHALRSTLSKEEQKAGIAWVVENHGPVTTADLIAADIRCEIFPERSYDKDLQP